MIQLLFGSVFAGLAILADRRCTVAGRLFSKIQCIRMVRKAISLPEPFSGDLPADARSLGLRYFLEVSIAKEFLVDWVRSIEREPALNEKCRRLIQYAIHDA